jgi:hypothetical protein
VKRIWVDIKTHRYNPHVNLRSENENKIGSETKRREEKRREDKRREEKRRERQREREREREREEGTLGIPQTAFRSSESPPENGSEVL